MMENGKIIPPHWDDVMPNPLKEGEYGVVVYQKEPFLIISSLRTLRLNESTWWANLAEKALNHLEVKTFKWRNKNV